MLKSTIAGAALLASVNYIHPYTNEVRTDVVDPVKVVQNHPEARVQGPIGK